jgi:hypothetical protein
MQFNPDKCEYWPSLRNVNHYTMTTPYMDTYSNMLILRNT